MFLDWLNQNAYNAYKVNELLMWDWSEKNAQERRGIKQYWRKQFRLFCLFMTGGNGSLVYARKSRFGTHEVCLACKQACTLFQPRSGGKIRKEVRLLAQKHHLSIPLNPDLILPVKVRLLLCRVRQQLRISLVEIEQLKKSSYPPYRSTIILQGDG